MSSYCSYCNRNVRVGDSCTNSHCTHKRIEDDSGDFLISSLVGYATNSAIIGGLVGGDITGGIVGDFFNGGDLFD